MSRTINITCPNCNGSDVFNENELKSELAIKDDQGNVIDASPPVEVDENTIIACNHCGYPIICTPDNVVIK